MALAVGCSHYEDDDIADLRFAHLDALRMGEVFRDSMDIPEEAVFVFADELPESGPTRHNVIRTLSRLAKHAAAPIDRLYFFFSGHGFHSTADGEDYLITREALTDALEDTSLNFAFLVRMLRATGARHVVLLLDACRTPVAGGKSLFATARKVDVERLCPPGMVSFCSCSPGTSSYESDRLESGLFTEALCSAFGDDGRCITVAHLDGYLTTHVPRLAREYDKPQQEPYSRLEPAALVDLEVVSPRKRNEWRASARVGEELRQQSVVRVSSAKIPERAPLAIDFGTTNSVVAAADDESGIHFIPGSDGRRLVPSVVTFAPDLDYLVGSRAVDLERYSAGRTVRAIKRRLGTDQTVSIDGTELSAELVSSLVIRSLRANAEEVLGELPREAMVSYPANFSIRQNNSLLRAFELAGLKVMRMVGEPNIASVLLHLDQPDWEGVALVVDLGGGTLDVAVTEVMDEVHEIKSVYGDNHLGGLDFDVTLADLLKERLRAWNSAVTFDAELEAQILKEAERAKHVLTEDEAATVVIQDMEIGSEVLSYCFTIDRSEFRETCAELTARFAEVVRAAVVDAYESPLMTDPIAVVMITGMGGKIFTVRESLEGMLGDVKFVETYQDLAVGQGLALYSSLLAGSSTALAGAVPLLLDLSHRGIGIRCSPVADPDSKRMRKAPGADGHTEVLVERLTTIPTRRSDDFKFVGAAGAEVVLPVIERSKMSDEDVEIGIVSFPAEQEEVEIELTVEIDANGVFLLHVADHSNDTYRFYQLNQYYQQPSVRGEILDLLLDGWTVHDIEPVDPAFRVADGTDRTAPTTLNDLDIPAEIARLAESLESEVTRRKGESYVYAEGIFRVRAITYLRIARLLFAADRRTEGARALADSLHALLTLPPADRPWTDITVRINLAGHRLLGTPDLDLVTDTLAQMTTWTEADLRTGLSEGGTALSDLPNAIGGLRAIGAERVARHLESLIGKRPES
ncbi:MULTISPECIES: Hsp70 family protein [unclassified Streptomyces]|uniref:Hsp70 family protein n=1 Tax=unclassified Streptomyces TaxID=2593676 RepID=UPI0030DE2C5E